MALLDVSEVLDDDLFASDFVLKRRIQTVGQDGRASVAVTASDESSVICSASPKDLERIPEYQIAGRAISLVTRLTLRGPEEVAPLNGNPSVQYMPDVINWQGSDYVVQHVDLYTHYGDGFVQAIATSMNTIDPVVT